MAFGQRYGLKFSLAAMINADAMISLPDYKAEERLLGQTEKLLDFSPEKIIIQSYNSVMLFLRELPPETTFRSMNPSLKQGAHFSILIFKDNQAVLQEQRCAKGGIFARALAAKLRTAVIQAQIEDKISVIGRPFPASGKRIIIFIII